jgi:hypothetical protein
MQQHKNQNKTNISRLNRHRVAVDSKQQDKSFENIRPKMLVKLLAKV